MKSDRASGAVDSPGARDDADPVPPERATGLAGLEALRSAVSEQIRHDKWVEHARGEPGLAGDRRPTTLTSPCVPTQLFCGQPVCPT